jgi:hypothetical protein
VAAERRAAASRPLASGGGVAVGGGVGPTGTLLLLLTFAGVLAMGLGVRRRT